MVAFVLDLTERKRAEAEARESERRYRQVQSELAHANRVATMGQLTASVAHEVNQPIAATVTNAQAGRRWLDRQPPDLEEARQAFDRIVRDGNRAGDVIGRVRALVKKAPVRRDRLEINSAIRGVVELIHGESVKHGIAVRADLADGLPLIEGDRVQLQQVVLNLMISAVQAVGAVAEGSREVLVTKVKPNRTACASRSGIRGRASLRRVSTAFSSPSTRPSLAVWAWGYRFAVRSSKRMGDECGPARMNRGAPSFSLRCPQNGTTPFPPCAPAKSR
jgi:signal transduction histidine kinase